MRKLILFLALTASISSIQSCKKKGCTDPIAINYDDQAEKDDGSCTYPPEIVINGNVTTPQSYSNQTVKICGNITVSSTLTFGEGTNVIMCAGATVYVVPSGSFISSGTAAKPVYIRGESSTKGYWNAFVIESANANNKMEYTNISDGGGDWYYEYAGVYMNNGSLMKIQNSRFSNMKTYGLFVNNNATLPNFSTNVFQNIDGYGIHVFATQLPFLDAASTYNLNNTNPYVFVKGTTIGGTTTWPNLNQAVLIDGSINITGSLTINPGASFTMEAQSDIYVNSTGSLNCTGNASNKISFVGKSPTAGYWTGIIFNSVNNNNKLHHCIVRDGGFDWYYEYAGIYVTNSGRLDIFQTEVSNSNSYGLYKNSTGSLYSNSTAITSYGELTSNNNFFGNGAGGGVNCTTCACNLP